MRTCTACGIQFSPPNLLGELLTNSDQPLIGMRCSACVRQRTTNKELKKLNESAQEQLALQNAQLDCMKRLL